jgi:branched-chain amino acid transport system substrate-binding protein
VADHLRRRQASANVTIGALCEDESNGLLKVDDISRGDSRNLKESVMRSRRTAVLTIAVTLGLGAVLSLPALAQNSPGVTKDEIKIGTFGALIGPNYLYGKLTMNGVDALFDKVNSEGGIYGRKLVLLREDDRCDPAAAIGAVKKLVYQDQVFAIIGGACSNATLGAKRELVQSKVPYINFSAAADAISDPPEHNIYTVVPTSSGESRAQLEYAVSHGAKRIAVVAQHDAWGQARYEPLMAAFKKRGLSPAVDLEMTAEDNDATPQALQIAQAHADAVLHLIYPKPSAVLVRSLNKLGQNPMLIGYGGIGDPVAFAKLVAIPGATDKFVAPAYSAHSPSDPAMSEWAARVKKLFPNDELSIYTLTGIASAEVMVAALKKAGRELTRENFLDAMANIEVATDIFPDPVQCNDPVSHQCYKNPVWVRAEGDRAVPIK